MVKIQTYLIPIFLVTTEVSVTIDEVPRPTGCIFLQSIVYQQCSGISVADMKMLRFLTHITTRKLKKMNISFVKLEDNHKLHKYELSKSDENRKNRKPTFVDCADCVDFELHIKTATKARERYRQEKNPEWTDNEKVVSVDMQKVIMLARLRGLKVVVLCKRIVVFNETFASVGESKNGKDKATGVLWHEGIRGRSTVDVVGTFPSFIRKN